MPTRVFQPVDKTVELTVQALLNGELVENKFYAKGSSAINAAMVAALASLVDSWVAAAWLPVLPETYNYTRSIARDLTVEASFESVDATHGGTPGGLAVAGLPNNVSLAVHRDTGLSGKKAKSRVYIPGIANGFVTTPNTITTAGASAFIGALDTLRSDILLDSTNTWAYGYVQRVLDHVRLAAGNFIEVFSHSLVDHIIDSQRARLPLHGL